MVHQPGEFKQFPTGGLRLFAGFPTLVAPRIALAAAAAGRRDGLCRPVEMQNGGSNISRGGGQSEPSKRCAAAHSAGNPVPLRCICHDDYLTYLLIQG